MLTIGLFFTAAMYAQPENPNAAAVWSKTCVILRIKLSQFSDILHFVHFSPLSVDNSVEKFLVDAAKSQYMGTFVKLNIFQPI